MTIVLKQFRNTCASMLTNCLYSQVFCEVAYHAKTRNHIVDGMDEFMDDLTVLPPSLWDPSIRLEPPGHTRPMVCSQILISVKLV